MAGLVLVDLVFGEIDSILWLHVAKSSSLNELASDNATCVNLS